MKENVLASVSNFFTLIILTILKNTVRTLQPVNIFSINTSCKKYTFKNIEDIVGKLYLKSINIIQNCIKLSPI